MMNVVPFTGGKRCVDCEEQIEPARVAANPGARRCLLCEIDREGRIDRGRMGSRPQDIEIIRG